MSIHRGVAPQPICRTFGGDRGTTPRFGFASFRAASCVSKAGMRGSAKPGATGTIPFRPRDKEGVEGEAGETSYMLV